eukprot:CAMPEP_0197655242 /NCGR_PEP_ID=MMETSP1338-20131121/39337_1 /TAXON_ID=43686 ORGANISM="Pelagodinium beii, Strain RCC1491" /NCGR_SAMPLE_ID=MMETSP1338 /ASSEMBLY_ACC=CAM_ASM_000754 /LENGTH=235 /DNA_ID=CAMNT_0043230855 /DNA_START=1 /DNA_END=708 /DNA_ORIENTATION=-
MANEHEHMARVTSLLREQDPDISHPVIHSQFVVAYLLQQDGPNPGWRKANIEGAVYLVKRNTFPKYQLLVKNQFNTSDLLDNLHPDWELDCQKNYIFYKVEDTNERIRGLWFHDDTERQKIENALESVLEEIRKQPEKAADSQAMVAANPLRPQQAQHQAMQGQMDGPAAPPPMNNENHMDVLYSQFGLRNTTEQAASQDNVAIAPASVVRAVLHALADDEQFIRMLMQKINNSQ